jgi:hypothetical protein
MESNLPFIRSHVHRLVNLFMCCFISPLATSTSLLAFSPRNRFQVSGPMSNMSGPSVSSVNWWVIVTFQYLVSGLYSSFHTTQLFSMFGSPGTRASPRVTVLKVYWLPTVKAAIELNSNNAAPGSGASRSCRCHCSPANKCRVYGRCLPRLPEPQTLAAVS